MRVEFEERTPLNSIPEKLAVICILIEKERYQQVKSYELSASKKL